MFLSFCEKFFQAVSNTELLYLFIYEIWILRRKINLGNKLASNFTHEIFFFPFSRNIFTLLLLFFFTLSLQTTSFQDEKGKPGGKKSSVFETEWKTDSLQNISNKTENLEKFQKFFFPRVKPVWKVFPRIPRKSRNVLFFFMCERERKIKFFCLQEHFHMNI